MPRFNALGQIADQRRDWYDATRTVFQHCEGGHCDIVLSDGTVEKEQGANTVIGGGGFWAAWLDLSQGVFDAAGHTYPLAGIMASGMGPDGAYALKVRFESYGPWDVIERNGARWRLTDGDIDDRCVQLLGGRQAIWLFNGWLHMTPGLPLTHPQRALWTARAAWNGSRFVLLGQDRETGQLLLDGRVIAPTGNYFYPDVAFVDGRYLVTWSPNQADTDAQLLTLTPEQLAACPLVTSSPVVVTPPPVVVTPPVEPPVSEWNAPAELIEYFSRRWIELRVQEQIDAAPDDRHVLGAIASDALFLIAGEWHHTLGHTNIGLYPKTSGTNHRGFGEDILLHRDTQGRVFWKDVIVGAGGKTPRLSFGPFLQSDQPEKFAVPPKPEGAPQKPPVVVPPACDCEAMKAQIERIAESAQAAILKADEAIAASVAARADAAAAGIKATEALEAARMPRPLPPLKIKPWSHRWLGSHTHDIEQG